MPGKIKTPEQVLRATWAHRGRDRAEQREFERKREADEARLGDGGGAIADPDQPPPKIGGAEAATVAEQIKLNVLELEMIAARSRQLIAETQRLLRLLGS